MGKETDRCKMNDIDDVLNRISARARSAIIKKFSRGEKLNTLHEIIALAESQTETIRGRNEQTKRTKTQARAPRARTA